MKILRADSRVERIALTQPYAIAYAAFDAVEILHVRLELEDGRVGLGAGSPAEAITGERAEESAAALEHHLEALTLGADVRRLPALLGHVGRALGAWPAARAALDIALHDLWGKVLEAPLVEVLGRAQPMLPTSITLGIQDPESAADEARRRVADGFRILKIKIGAGLALDLAALQAIRRAVGPGVGLRVDANQGYAADELGALLTACEGLGVELVEQPLPAESDHAMAALPEPQRRRCAADESLHHAAHGLRLSAAPQPFGIFNIKLMKCGGIAPARQIAALAETAGLELMWGCMDESVISIAAALHVALASPATRYLDLDGSFDLSRDPARGGFRLVAGCLDCLDRPGLGVDERAPW
ncbi:MAG: dipeptide epimerase [Acidobacteriota bacterium]